MVEEAVPGYPSKDYITDEPRYYMTVKNPYTGGDEEVLIDPVQHDGVVTRQQQEAVKNNLLHGSGIRLALEGNIGSGKSTLGFWLVQALRDSGVPAWWKPERLEEWGTKEGNLLNTSRKDPK